MKVSSWDAECGEVGIEIERKFLVKGRAWVELAEQTKRIRQAYLSMDPDRIVRLRTIGDEAFITVKSRAVQGVRSEYEYAVPLPDAVEMIERMAFCPWLEKTRHYVRDGGVIWEIDEFHGSLEGLVVAEVELRQVDQHVEIPSWVGSEVTGIAAFANSMLVREPDAWKNYVEGAGQ